jgi:hypothetical protein
LISQKKKLVADDTVTTWREAIDSVNKTILTQVAAEKRSLLVRLKLLELDITHVE